MNNANIRERVEHAIMKAEELGEWICDTLYSLEYRQENARDKISLGCLILAVRHHRAIVILLKYGLNESAFALARPMTEAYHRGIWFRECASEKHIEQYKSGKFRCSVKQMIDDIEKAGCPPGILSSAHSHNNDTLNSFVHSGRDQLVLLDISEVMSAREEAKFIEGILQSVNAYAFQAGTEILQFVAEGGNELAEAFKAKLDEINPQA